MNNNKLLSTLKEIEEFAANAEKKAKDYNNNNIKADEFHSDSQSSCLIVNVNIFAFEKFVDKFIKNELKKTSLLTQISSSNNQITSLLNQLYSFNEEKSYYVNNFFGSGFSSADKQKWSEIENLVNQVYNSQTGKIKEVWCCFFSSASWTKSLESFTKTKVCTDQDLLIRAILVEDYLNKLRKLILPFSQLDDNFSIDFKKKRIKFLEKKNNESNELSLLREQTHKEAKLLQMQKQNAKNFRDIEQNILSCVSEKINSDRIEKKPGIITSSSAETICYFASLISQKIELDSSKEITNSFGLETNPTILKLIQFVSTNKQVNNNRSFHNYEKKMKLVNFLEIIKRNLLAHEEQVVNYYIDNILNQLQLMLAETDWLIYSLVSKSEERCFWTFSTKKPFGKIFFDKKITQLGSQNFVTENEINPSRRAIDKIDSVLKKSCPILEKDQLKLTNQKLLRKIDQRNLEINKLKEELSTKCLYQKNSNEKKPIIWEENKENYQKLQQTENKTIATQQKKKISDPFDKLDQIKEKLLFIETKNKKERLTILTFYFSLQTLFFSLIFFAYWLQKSFIRKNRQTAKS